MNRKYYYAEFFFGSDEARNLFDLSSLYFIRYLEIWNNNNIIINLCSFQFQNPEYISMISKFQIQLQLKKLFNNFLNEIFRLRNRYAIIIYDVKMSHRIFGKSLIHFVHIQSIIFSIQHLD